MQTDPVGYKDGLNWYDYVHNDPVNGSDPSGDCTGSLFSNSDGTCLNGGGTTDIQGDAEGMHPGSGSFQVAMAGPHPPIGEGVAEGAAAEGESAEAGTAESAGAQAVNNPLSQANDPLGQGRMITALDNKIDAFGNKIRRVSEEETNEIRKLLGSSVAGAREAIERLESGNLSPISRSALEKYKAAITAKGPKTANAPVNVLRLYVIDTPLGLH